MRNTSVGTSDNIIRRKALASETLIVSIVNLSSPRSSVRETILGMYLDAADAEWKGADDVEDILSVNNNNEYVYIILI